MIYLDRFLALLGSLPDALIYFFLGLSAFVENIFPPIPGDTITAFGAFLVGTGRLSFFGVYAATTLGSLAGFMSLFWVGGILGRRFFMEKDLWFFKARDIRRAEAWFRRYGYLLILLNRFFPGIRSVISIAGGISRLNPLTAAGLALLSAGIWNFLWIAAGFALGTHWDAVKARMAGLLVRYNMAVLAAACLVIGLLVVRKVLKRGPGGES